MLKVAIAAIRDRLPLSWSVRERELPRGARVDALLRVGAPDGQQVILAIEAKKLVATRDVAAVLEQLQQVALSLTGESVVPVIAARYLPPAARERIAAAGAGYVDATGNLLARADQPALFIADRGADRDPWRGPGRPRGTLQGLPAARVARALIDYAPPYSVPDLAQRAGASTGASYRAVEFLEEEELIERERRGPITDVRWRRLLKRWSEDYGFAKSNTVTTFLEPRGLQALTARLLKLPRLEYVMTGSLAAAQVAPFAPPRLAMLYVRDLSAAVEALELRPVDSGGNVAIATGMYELAAERADRGPDLIRYAAFSQVAVDLLTGPGRNPSEAESLLGWMERHEPAWRR